jgi:pimeloyl-ACP methyl ester carboxylesterase
MDKTMRLYALVFGLSLLVGVWGCSSNSADDNTLTGPQGYDKGNGLSYALQANFFSSIDSVQVDALYGRPQQIEGKLPVVILIHAFGRNYGLDWFQVGTLSFEDFLLDQGYIVLAINLRGHGNTLLPDNRQSYQLEDLENSYLDVQAALIWLRGQPEVDISRVAVVGAGFGGNVAYVSMGSFPQQIKTAVVLSPGFWDTDNNSIAIGAGLDPFAPHSTLFVVGENNLFRTPEGAQLSSVAVASDLHASTQDPKELRILPGEAAFGVDLLCDPAAPGCNSGARGLLLNWLRDHL